MRGRIAAQILLAIVASGCGGAVNREFTSPEGRYRVQFPGKPRLVEQPPIKTPWGPVVEKFAATETYQTIRFVSYSDYPGGLIHPGNADSMLDDACQGWAADKQLTILSKGPISVNGHSGREINFEARPGSPVGKVSGRTRFFLVRGRLYHVGVIGPSGRVTPESIDGFLNSFALLESGSQPSAAPIAAAPSPAPRSPSGFYTIPEPAIATLVADHTGGTVVGRGHRLPSPGSEDASTASPPTASAGGASIRSFEWIDENADLVGGRDDAARSDGNPDHHLRMVLELPPNTIVEEMIVKSQGFHRWVTKPNDRFWPVAIFQRGRPVARAHVAQVGVYSGSQKFDLYVNTSMGIGPGSPFEVQVVLSIAGNRVVLGSECKRPEQPSGSLARAQRPRLPQAPGQPDAPGAPSATPAPKPAPPPITEVRPSPRGGRESTEVPVLLKPSAGGATIASFDWLDQKEDWVGTSGRTFEPGGGKDEHYRLVLDLPAATTIEEIVITGGGVLRYTTMPSTRFLPVAVYTEHRAVIRGQSLRVGTFSGQFTFDLYVESHNTVRPDHVFGVEVVVMIRGTRHSLTARCQRK
jgi:hypothetical protein